MPVAKDDVAYHPTIKSFVPIVLNLGNIIEPGDKDRFIDCDT